MLTKRTTIDRIEVLPETGHIQVRQKIAVIESEDVETTDESGATLASTVEHELSYSFHRYVLEPGSDLTGQPDEVRSIAEAAWVVES